MNNIINKFLLAGDKVYARNAFKTTSICFSACGPFSRNKE